jgi:4-amino-4-deoxy-L-arabinose transferase-like glycosyltransferase
VGSKLTLGGRLPATGIAPLAGVTVARYWPLVALVLLMPLWIIGVVGRAVWSPDEPREHDIAYNMLQSGDVVVPQLAGAPFVEKPPLAYWVQSASMRLFGPSILAARLPNLLWAALTVLCIGALGGDVAGPRVRAQAALLAAIACGTVILILQVQIWLATDAPLLGLTALALLSGWRLAHADSLRRQLIWSLLFGISLAGGILAKNAFGLLVPVLTIVIWFVWERRLRDLVRWPWWVAAAACALLVGAWLLALANRPGGDELLRALLWDNVTARFLPVQSEAAYELGHQSSHWKFLLLLPMYVLPWTFAVLAAGRWGASAARHGTESRSGVRYCIAAVVPACIVLLISRTVRGIYFAPALLGVPVLLALWFTIRSGALSRSERTALRLSRYTLQALAKLFAGTATLLLVFVGIHTFAAVAAVTMTAFVFVGIALSLGANHGPTHGLTSATALYLAALAALELVAFPVIDRTENLGALFAAAGPRLARDRVATYCTDETTRATLDSVLELRLPDVCTIESARQLLRDHSDQQFLVLLAPPRSAQRFRELFPDVHLSRATSRPPRTSKGVSDLASLGLQPAACWSVPGGRKYALYASLTSAPGPAPAFCSTTH